MYEFKYMCTWILSVPLNILFSTSRYKSLCPATWPNWDGGKYMYCSHVYVKVTPDFSPGNLHRGVERLCRHLQYTPEQYKLGKWVLYSGSSPIRPLLNNGKQISKLQSGHLTDQDTVFRCLDWSYRCSSSMQYTCTCMFIGTCIILYP